MSTDDIPPNPFVPRWRKRWRELSLEQKMILGYTAVFILLFIVVFWPWFSWIGFIALPAMVAFGFLAGYEFREES